MIFKKWTKMSPAKVLLTTKVSNLHTEILLNYVQKTQWMNLWQKMQIISIINFWKLISFCRSLYKISCGPIFVSIFCKMSFCWYHCFLLAICKHIFKTVKTLPILLVQYICGKMTNDKNLWFILSWNDLFFLKDNK